MRRLIEDGINKPNFIYLKVNWKIINFESAWSHVPCILSLFRMRNEIFNEKGSIYWS